MERKEYYEVNLPPYLQHDLDAMKEGKYPYDCLWGEIIWFNQFCFCGWRYYRRAGMVFKGKLFKYGKGVKR